MGRFDNTSRVMSGTWGQCWLDNELVAEVYKAAAKVSYNKTEIPICGQMGVDVKVTGYKGTGSLGMQKVNSRMGQVIGKAIRDGRDIRFTVILKLADPDSFGHERVRLKNVSFDDLTLMDWEAGTPGKIEAPFTFTDYDYLDEVDY